MIFLMFIFIVVIIIVSTTEDGWWAIWFNSQICMQRLNHKSKYQTRVRS